MRWPRSRPRNTPRYDFQGLSDAAALARVSARLGIKPANGEIARFQMLEDGFAVSQADAADLP
jgi:hypothetical protein